MKIEPASNKIISRENHPFFSVLCFGLPILALVVLAYLSINVDKAEQDATSWVTHTQKVPADLQGVLSQLQDMETGQRGYILTGNIDYLAPFNSALNHLDSELLDLRILTSDNPKQRDSFNALTALVNDKKTELMITIELRKAEGFEAALSMVKTDSGKIIMDQIRDVIKKIGEEENALLVIRQGEVKALRSTIKYLYGLVIVLITAFSAILFYQLRLARKNARSAIQVSSELQGRTIGH